MCSKNGDKCMSSLNNVSVPASVLATLNSDGPTMEERIADLRFQVGAAKRRLKKAKQINDLARLDAELKKIEDEVALEERISLGDVVPEPVSDYARWDDAAPVPAWTPTTGAKKAG